MTKRISLARARHVTKDPSYSIFRGKSSQNENGSNLPLANFPKSPEKNKSLFSSENKSLFSFYLLLCVMEELETRIVPNQSRTDCFCHIFRTIKLLHHGLEPKLTYILVVQSRLVPGLVVVRERHGDDKFLLF